MKFLFKIATVFMALNFFSVLLNGNEIKKIDSENSLDPILRKKCSQQNKLEKNSKIRTSYLRLLANSFDIPDESGVTLLTRPVQINDTRTIVLALSYPNDYVKSAAEVTFEISKKYKRKLDSALKLIFRASPSLQQIKGNVKFSLVAEVKHRDGSSSTINLGKATKKNVKSSTLIGLDEMKGSLYTLDIKTSGKFSKGDIVNLTVRRINSNKDNFNNPVFVPSLLFIYNKN